MRLRIKRTIRRDIGSQGCRGRRLAWFPHPPFNPYVRFPAYGLPMIFLTWLRRLRIADCAAQRVQAVPVEPVLVPYQELNRPQVPAPLLDHQAAEPPHHIPVILAELAGGVSGAEVVVPSRLPSLLLFFRRWRRTAHHVAQATGSKFGSLHNQHSQAEKRMCEQFTGLGKKQLVTLDRPNLRE